MEWLLSHANVIDSLLIFGTLFLIMRVMKQINKVNTFSNEAIDEQIKINKSQMVINESMQYHIVEIEKRLERIETLLFKGG